jgi:DNA primase
MKYYTSPGPKPLYSPYHIFGDFHTVGQLEELTICEGVFDAIALAIMGFPNPVAILGDKLTPLQMWDIRHLVPTTTKIYLCLDDVERSRYTQKLVKKFIPCVEETEIFATWSPFGDPEEWLVGQLKENVSLKEEMTQRVIEWVHAFTPQGDTTNA